MKTTLIFLTKSFILHFIHMQIKLDVCISILSLILYSQDLISANLSPNITQKEKYSVFISHQNDEQIINQYLPFDGIQGYYTNMADTLKTKAKDFETIRFAADFGWGMRTSKLLNSFTRDEENITNGLRSGLTWSVNGDFYFNKSCGLGLKALFFETRNNLGGYLSRLSGEYYSGDVDQSSSTYYFGPEFIVRLYASERKNLLWAGISLGYMNYFQSISSEKNIFNVSGSCFGVCLDIGYDIRIFKKIGLGIGMYYVFGAPSEYTFQDEKGLSYIISQPKENLGRIGITLGFRFYN